MSRGGRTIDGVNTHDAIRQALAGQQPVTARTLARQIKRPVNEALAHLNQLELKGEVRRHPNGDNPATWSLMSSKET